ncbi:MAG TPA: UDP-glucose/GDP-mannose dehydrogenase family protein, partial [Actinomycetota bacterium]|nr:UDP-glucose/GDP-mannose dehydrogenase family protein [Actinomycetota bacterium]
GDARETPAIPTMRALARRGADVRFHDPFVDRVTLNGTPLERRDLDEAVAEADLVVLLTPHSDYDLERLAASARIVFDTRNAYRGRRPANVVGL